MTAWEVNLVNPPPYHHRPQSTAFLLLLTGPLNGSNIWKIWTWVGTLPISGVAEQWPPMEVWTIILFFLNRVKLWLQTWTNNFTFRWFSQIILSRGSSVGAGIPQGLSRGSHKAPAGRLTGGSNKPKRTEGMHDTECEFPGTFTLRVVLFIQAWVDEYEISSSFCPLSYDWIAWCLCSLWTSARLSAASSFRSSSGISC